MGFSISGKVDIIGIVRINGAYVKDWEYDGWDVVSVETSPARDMAMLFQPWQASEIAKWARNRGCPYEKIDPETDQVVVRQ